MIFTLRTYQVNPKDHAEFVRLSEEKEWPELKRRGARAMGLWNTVMGGADRLVEMTKYDSLAHWQEIQDWGDSGGGDVSSRAALITDSEVIALSPLTRQQPDGDAPEEDPGIYTVRRFTIARKDIKRAVELSEEGWWPWVRKGQGLRPIGQWMSIIAPETRMYMMARYNDLAHWEATRGIDPEPEDPEMHALWERGFAAIAERTKMTIHTDVSVLRPISSRRP